jgi:hypothetical protein
MSAHQLPDGVPRLSPGLGGNGAGVDHNDISRLFRQGHPAAGRLKSALKGRRFILVYLAAKGADGYFLHFSGVIVAY